jgi:hypothetical protein
LTEFTSLQLLLKYPVGHAVHLEGLTKPSVVEYFPDGQVAVHKLVFKPDV